MCDTAAMIYLPLLEETGYLPSQKYVPAPEIFAHARRIATTFDLYDGALFSTEVTELRWDEASRRGWCAPTAATSCGRGSSRWAPGPLHRPKLPGHRGPGVLRRALLPHQSLGLRLHRRRSRPVRRWTVWPDRRVGIIGTGATAVQCIPHLARDAGELFVFQRTPSSIDVRANHPIDPDEFAALGPGWQREWLLNFATLQTGGFTDEDLVKDGWTDIAQRIRDRVVAEVTDGAELTPETIQRAFEDERRREDGRDPRPCRRRSSHDPATAEALKPWYRQLCKRPCFHDEYLQAYNEPGVHLVDTDGQGVDRVDETGVWVGDRHYEVDCLIFASGFEVGTDQSRRSRLRDLRPRRRRPVGPLGRRACRPCTASTSTGSRTCSWSGSARART